MENAAYAAAAEAIEAAAGRGASFARLDARARDGALALVVEDDGAAYDSPPGSVADRVGAVGGRVELGPRTLRAELPLGA